MNIFYNISILFISLYSENVSVMVFTCLCVFVPQVVQGRVDCLC